MTTVGYYISGNRGGDGTWALIAVDDKYRDAIVVGDLAYEEAVALYWEKLGTLQRQLASPGGEQSGDDVPAPSPPKRQLTFKF
jgi:hypothetical protein